MAFVDRTRELFAPLITKPPLTDQLLQRPPFKFIADVVAATINSTGYLSDLFGHDHLDISNITDKNGKIEFLQTLIDVLNVDGSLDEVKPSKIVAGKESEMTNLMLQKLASQAQRHRETSSSNSNKENSTKSSKSKSKSSSSDPKKSKKKEKENGSSSKDRENGHKSSSRERENGHKSSSKEKENGHSSSSKSKSRSDSKSRRKSSAVVESSDKNVRSKSKSKTKSEKPPVAPVPEDPAEDDGLMVTDVVADGHDAHPPEPEDEVPLPHPSFARPVTSSGRPQTSMGRPGTAMARPAPPKLQKKQIAVLERPVEAVVADATDVIIDEREEQQEEEFLVVSEPEIEIPQVSANELDIEDHGNLVKKMLESKMEIEAADRNANRAEVFDESSQQKVRREIVNLQSEIQHMTQTSHPLARLFDFVQEDFEGMLKEVDEWRKEVKKNTGMLRDQGSFANKQQYARAIQLKQLDQEIKDIRSNISRVRAAVLANEEKILQQMTNI